MKFGHRFHESASLIIGRPLSLPLSMQRKVRELLKLKADEPGKGHGTQLLRKVCGEADTERYALMVHVEPFDSGMTSEQLVEWYQTFNFAVFQETPACLMLRTPK